MWAADLDELLARKLELRGLISGRIGVWGVGLYCVAAFCVVGRPMKAVGRPLRAVSRPPNVPGRSEALCLATAHCPEVVEVEGVFKLGIRLVLG